MIPKVMNIRPSVDVGKYWIAEHPPNVVTGRPLIWIEHESGEGMAADMKDFESVVEKFYKDNF